MSEEVEFTIKAKMNARWKDNFISMLKYMEVCGDVGKSRTVGFYADGDGDFRPTFDIDIDYKIVDPKLSKNGNRLYDAG